MSRFAMVDAAESECLGVVAYARDWKPGDMILQGAAGDLSRRQRARDGGEDRLPVLVVELVRSEA